MDCYPGPALPARAQAQVKPGNDEAENIPAVLPLRCSRSCKLKLRAQVGRSSSNSEAVGQKRSPVAQ
ncbi:MAG: hypothetical protein AAF354_09165, partial [Pseudomonadota bacterium]